MTTSRKLLGILIGLASLVAVSVLLFTYYVQTSHAASTQVPGITIHSINPPTGTQDFYTFFVATTTTATSTTAASSQDPGFLRVGGATDVLFYFSRGDTKGTGNTGSSIFKVQVSPDGVNWFDYGELGAVIPTATADTYFARVGSATVPAGTSTAQYVMDDISYYAVRCIAVRVTDGESTCKATARF